MHIIKMKLGKVQVPHYLYALSVATKLSEADIVKAWNRSCYLLENSNIKGRALNSRAMELSMLSLFYSSAARMADIRPNDIEHHQHETRYTMFPLLINKGLIKCIVSKSAIERGENKDTLYPPYIIKTSLDNIEKTLKSDTDKLKAQLSEKVYLDCLKRRIILHLIDSNFHNTPITTQ